MEIKAPLDEPASVVAGGRRLPAADQSAAEALVAAMAGWNAADLAAYRASVLEECARRCGQAEGFLAVELAALAAVEVSVN